MLGMSRSIQFDCAFEKLHYMTKEDPDIDSLSSSATFSHLQIIITVVILLMIIDNHSSRA